MAMRIAEDLYTQGLISYPRTDNTVYPRGLGLRTLVEKFKDGPFAEAAEFVLQQPSFRPTRGRTETTDHPPIYPTGVVDPKKLRPDHAKVYELVVRRFLSDARSGRGRHRADRRGGDPRGAIRREGAAPHRPWMVPGLPLLSTRAVADARPRRR